MEFPVVVEKVSKSYDGVRDVVKDVDIKVAQGEMVLLWGRNGSGKTTLLNLVGCIDVPSSGKVTVAGKDTSELSPRQLARLRLMSIGHVFQHHNLIDDLTVEENVLLPLKIARDGEADAKAKSLLATFELDILAKKRPGEISGGESQKVAIARALANDPAILLADEPTASLDSKSCEIVLDAFRRIREGFDATVIVASHDPLLYDHIEKKFFLFDGRLKTGPEDSA
ncbi:MAG: ABC transporter ATP-binding protein [Thermoplasmata archaeon]|nr:ABC transporter ATP-binding protein [Thermoplasmata archaeon]